MEKSELIKLLKADKIKEFNEIVKDFKERLDLIDANLRGANLRGADLHGANLQGANLQGAYLRGADLHCADLRYADLHGADLHYADLQVADLFGADLVGADLDYSCLSFSCNSLKFKSDEKQRIQIAFHLLSLIYNSDNRSDKEIEIYNYMLDYANKFHRTDVKRLENI